MLNLHLKHICLAVGIASIPAYAADLELSSAGQPTLVGNAASAGEWGKASYASNAGASVYIVELADPSVATYDGGINGLEATSNRSTGAKKLNTSSKKSKAYRTYLKKNQDKFVASVGAESKVTHNYQWVFNGVAIRMTADEADAMSAMANVKKVYRERIETPNTDNGPQWINADSIWSGPPNNVPHSQGEGIVIAVLDTGINHDNPSFADLGGDGYDHSNPLGSGNYLPGSYCDTTEPGFCNDKLIGAWSFVPADSNWPSPEDSDNHGSHTASTAAGNVVLDATTYGPTTDMTRAISGVAPHANIIAYDVCTDGCPGSALLAAINQVVVDASNLPDGIHALNYSISGGTDPYSDAVELGFLNATAAGVFVSTSAGNAGPGASTLGHQSPWVATTGASTHDREVVNSVTEMSSDGSSLPDIQGLGFTSGYGPETIINSADLEGAFPGSTVCGLGSIGDFISPWPAGTFNGEIVACTRGTFGRIEKGANALAAGAGGYILMDNGGGLVGDAHVLPGVHISAADGAVLAAWLAANTNTTGSISGYSLDIDPSNGDVMAGFSSRGPNSALDILKPDVTAPGVDILAAYATTNPTDPPEYGFLSGTSMSSPHHAGAGAIVSAAQPGWTPYAVKSAIMLTTDNVGVLKEDGVTPADPFDMGSGRVDLSRAIEADLVMDESPLNFLDANPATGGDPRTLNIASMQDGTCVADCSWTRTFTNTAKNTIHVDLSASGSDGATYSVEPASLKIKKGQTGSFTVTADTRLASGWNFGQVDVHRLGDGPDMHLPIAVNAVTSTAPTVFTKSVDQADASNGDILTYTMQIVNGQLAGNIDLMDTIPGEVTAIASSATAVVTNGNTSSPFTIDGTTASWSGDLAVGGIDVTDSMSPFGYFSLPAFGIAPFGCPGNCDDGAFVVNVPSFTYNGESHSSVIWSVNGTLEVGTASGSAAGAGNGNMPSATPPNNLLAPFWTDLNMGADGDGAEWYVAVLSAGPDQFTIYEWNNIPRFGDTSGDPSLRYTFQIWVHNNAPAGADNIWYAYAGMGDADVSTVGAEDSSGTVGSSYYFDGVGTPPVSGAELVVRSTAGGIATFTFEAEVDGCSSGTVIVNDAEISADNADERAIAATSCN